MGMRRLLAELGLVKAAPGEPRSTWAQVSGPDEDTPHRLVVRAEFAAVAIWLLMFSNAVFSEPSVWRVLTVFVVCMITLNVARIDELRRAARKAADPDPAAAPPA